MIKIADRVKNLPPYPFASLERRLRELKAHGKDIIRLDIGSPDLPPPDFVIEAMYRSAQEHSHHGYAGYYGTPEFRKAVAVYYERRFGVKLDPRQTGRCPDRLQGGHRQRRPGFRQSGPGGPGARPRLSDLHHGDAVGRWQLR